MLGKLLKYEFKATARILLPAYAVLLAISFIMRWTVGLRHPGEGALFDITRAVIAMAYGCILGMVCIVTVLLLIQRFYKNLLGDEGYLMHTLPVKPWQNIMAKLLPAVFWSLLSLFLAGLSSFIIVMSWHDWLGFWQGAADMVELSFQQLGGHTLLFGLEILLVMLISMAGCILPVYAALAAGHTANNHRILWSVAAYILITLVFSFFNMTLASLLNQLGLPDLVYNTIVAGDSIAATHIWLLCVDLLSLLEGAICFGLTAYLLQHRLNLE